jgi:hypothetical protein
MTAPCDRDAEAEVEGHLDFTTGFNGDILGEILLSNAVKRVVSFCSRSSGFVTYDLVSHAAREAGRLRDVGPWTVLVATALNGRVTVKNVKDFSSSVEDFVSRLDAVPQKPLAEMDESEVSRVVDFCSFGFSGAWAPKITKVGAVFRPEAIPILDGHLALAYGYERSAFSSKPEPRRAAINSVVQALSMSIKAQKTLLDELRRQVEESAPIVCILTDLRLADIVIWTSQDDRVERRTRKGKTTKRKDVWLTYSAKEAPTMDTIRWARLGENGMAGTTPTPP